MNSELFWKVYDIARERKLNRLSNILIMWGRENCELPFDDFYREFIKCPNTGKATLKQLKEIVGEVA